MLKRIIPIMTIVSLCLLSLLLVITTPTSAGPVGILFVYILLYVSLLGVVTFLTYGGSWVIARLTNLFRPHKTSQRLSLERAYYFSTVLALLPMMAMGLHAAGGISIYEVGLLAVFGGIGVLYIAKRS